MDTNTPDADAVFVEKRLGPYTIVRLASGNIGVMSEDENRVAVFEREPGSHGELVRKAGSLDVPGRVAIAVLEAAGAYAR